MMYISKKVNERNNKFVKRVYKYKKQIVEILVDSILIGGSFTISHFLRFEGDMNAFLWTNHDKLILIL